jgi:hypothetical protein
MFVTYWLAYGDESDPGHPNADLAYGVVTIEPAWYIFVASSVRFRGVWMVPGTVDPNK